MRKRNLAMARRKVRLHPFERQKVRQAWSERTVNAMIHALSGEDADAVRDKAGTLIYVILGAAIIERMSPDDPDIRILRGTANTLGEIDDTITALQRGTLTSGLEAVKRIVAKVDEESLFFAATAAKQRLNAGPVTLADFHAIGGQ